MNLSFSESYPVESTNPAIWDSGNKKITTAIVGETLQFSSDIKNTTNENLELIFHTMRQKIGVEDNDAWLTLSFKPNQEATPAISFIPEETGVYKIIISIFDNYDDQNLLAEQLTLELIVLNPTQLEGLEKFACDFGNGDNSELQYVQNIQKLLDSKKLILSFEEDVKIKEYMPSRDLDDWIKNNAYGWCDNMIDYNTYEQSLLFLVKEGNLSLEPISESGYMGNVGSEGQTGSYTLEEALEIQKRKIASFVDESKDPQSYVDRYNNEPTYKKWFDDNFTEYDSIEQAVGLTLTEKIPSWVKNIFGWYATDQVLEDELLNAIKYLIDEGILVVN